MDGYLFVYTVLEPVEHAIMLYVEGRTRPLREMLERLGFRYDGVMRAWVRPVEDWDDVLTVVEKIREVAGEHGVQVIPSDNKRIRERLVEAALQRVRYVLGVGGNIPVDSLVEILSRKYGRKIPRPEIGRRVLPELRLIFTDSTALFMYSVKGLAKKMIELIGSMPTRKLILYVSCIILCITLLPVVLPSLALTVGKYLLLCLSAIAKLTGFLLAQHKDLVDIVGCILYSVLVLATYLAVFHHDEY